MTRRGVARLNASTLAVDAGFVVNVVGSVNAITADGTHVYFTGDFTQVNGTNRGG